MLEMSNYEELELLLKDLHGVESKQRQAVRALWENNARFDILLEQSQAYIWAVDMEGLYTDLGTTVEKILGYRPEEIIGNMHFYDLHPDDGREAFKAAAFEVFSRKEIFRDLENRMQTKSGEVIWVGTSGIPIVDPEGNLEGYWGMDLNITKRKQAELERLANMHVLKSIDRVNRAIRGTNDLEQMMSDVLDEVLSIFNCDRAFFDYPCDPEAASWSAPVERTKPEYPGAHAVGFEAPMDADVAKIFRILLDSNGPVKFGPESEHPLPREMAKRFGYKSQLLMALYPKTGAPWVFGIHQCSYPRVWTQQEETLLQEIGEGRLTEGLTSFLMYRKLRDSEEKYRTMMEALVEPLAIFAHDYTIEYMNPSMIRRVGRDATGEKCYSSLHGLDAKCDWCDLDIVLQGKKSETTIRSPFDDRKYHISSMPIKKKDSTVSKMTIYRDITDYLKAVSEKEKAQAQLVQAQKLESIGNLAGGIAHDFNNILTSIIGYAELALDNAKNGWAVEDEVQEVLTASQRATDLVGQILAFARQSDENVKPLKVYNIIKEVLSFIRSTIPTSIEIMNSLESKAFILGNPTQVHQIIMNLCTNAAHAMEDEGGILDVRLKDLTIDKDFDNNKISLPSGNYIEISVSDSGTGIGPEIIDSIFEPYFTTKELGEGTGMGLAVVHGIVQSYGGDVIVESKLGKGTTFTTYLPVTSQHKGEHRYEPEIVPYGAERILFVDDEAQIARMGSQILERLGYKVATRTSSIEALELFRTKPNDFDLIITDMTMPNLNGDKLAKEILKIRADIPVILCTGYSKLITDESAAEIGIKAFVYKPIVKSNLAKIIRKVMGDVNGETIV